MKENKEKKVFKFTKQRMYTAALGSCAVIIALFAAIAGNMKKAPDITEQIVVTTENRNANVPVTNEPDTREKSTMIVPATEITTKSVTQPTTDKETESVKAVSARPAPEKYILPLGTNIGGDYSNGDPVYNEVMADWRSHDGVDFNGALGDGVKAAADGIVKDVYNDPLLGTVEVIDHGGEVYAYYCGLDPDSTRKKGEIIKQGDMIGRVGVVPVEASAEFPHLHLEIRVDGKLRDPLEVMKYYE